MDLSPEYLDPPTLAKIQSLELKARRTIEGLVSGPHRSPLQGVSVEFAEHREYVAGEDVRHLDWKLFGKTDRLFVKRYEQETNLVCNLVLDTSPPSPAQARLHWGDTLASPIPIRPKPPKAVTKLAMVTGEREGRPTLG